MTPQEKIKNNEFLLNLDIGKMSHEQKIMWLCQMIKNETEKPEDQRDADLIAECSDYLNELSGTEGCPAKEQTENALQEIKAGHPASNQPDQRISKCPGKLLKTVAVAAAILIALFSTLTVVATVSGYSSAWEMVMENVQRILNMETGDSFEENGITLMKNNQVVAYGTIEEFMEAEGYDILYPANMPDHIQIVNITEQVRNDAHPVLAFQFNHPGLSMLIATENSIKEEDLLGKETYEVNGMTYYIEAFSIGMYQATGHDSTYEYCIVSGDYDLLLSILNSMKGLEK